LSLFRYRNREDILVVVIRGQSVRAIDEIGFPEGIRRGEVAPTTADLGKNSPGVLPIATVVDSGGIHVLLLHVNVVKSTYT
jgi:hypothetical protein